MIAIFRYTVDMVVDRTLDLAEMARLQAESTGVQLVLQQALESLRQVVPYDLAAVLRLRGEELVVEAAAGPLLSASVRSHRVRLERFPTIQRALRTRRAVPLEGHHHASEEGDPYDGVLDLPHGHSCMVVPLAAGDRSLGVITLDRTECETYEDSTVRLAELYGQLVSVALQLTEEKQVLHRDRERLREHNRLLVEQSHPGQGAREQLETSPNREVQELVRLAKQAAPSDLPILVLGETGTGKEVLSQAIHEWSRRAHGPFVKLNCSAIAEGLVESELFGHKKGAFSGAERDRPGRFMTANGGTLLLDEIGDLPLAAQAKLLRVLQEGVFEPVGADEPCKVDVRVLAATHVDLEQAVADGRFRQDLWYRLAVFPLTIPALRARPEDALIIAQRFLQQHTGPGGPWQLSDEAKDAIRAAPWPGNVRELSNALERATVVQPQGVLTPEHLMLRAGPAAVAPAPSSEGPACFVEHERTYLQRLLQHCDGKLYGPGGAAERAQMNASTLRSKLVKHGLR